MNSTKKNERFQWNLGAWLGSQLGGTLWIFGIGISAINFGSVSAGVAILTAAVACNIAGFALWANRRRLSAYTGIQFLILAIGLASLITFIVLDLADLPLAYKFGGQQTQTIGFSPYLLMVLFPAMAILFYLMNRKDRAVNQTTERSPR